MPATDDRLSAVLRTCTRMVGRAFRARVRNIPQQPLQCAARASHGAASSFASMAVLLFAYSVSLLAENGAPTPPPNAVPWGIASSAGSMATFAEWLPKMSAVGVRWVRMFPEWRSVEPARGSWKWDSLDAMVRSAAENHSEIEAILMGSAPWSRDGSHAFPMNNLADWSDFVSASVDRYKQQIHCWEVWNEGNGGFNDHHNTTADYATLVTATRAAAKKADPNAQIGMTVASFDAPYLNQAILAQARDGHPNSFDFLCIHPYEIADGLADANGEIPFLWMAHLLRDALAASAPDRRDADIWITEVSRRIENKNGRISSEEDAARALVKIHTMALAQGIKRTLWFEARDPVGEDQGFGLLDREGNPRVACNAMKAMTTWLGAAPIYQGWLALGAAGHGYGFVFRGAWGPVMAAWMPAGKTDNSTTLTADALVIDPLTGGGLGAEGWPAVDPDLFTPIRNRPARGFGGAVPHARWQKLPLGRRLFGRRRSQPPVWRVR